MGRKMKRILALIVTFCVMTTNVYAFDYDFTESTNGIQISNNRGYLVESAIKYGQITKSYLNKNDDGTFTRVELINNNIFVEDYTSNFEYISTKQLPLELPRFGGAYFGEDYNFLVFLQNNDNEHDDREVVRVVKYDQDWNPLDSASVYGANTVKPNSSSNLSFLEKDGTLYIRTSHRLYADSDGANHQANFTIAIDIATMEVTGMIDDIVYESQGGVSHSFAEYMVTDGEEIFCIDLGDAYPSRSILLYRSPNPAGGSGTFTSLFDIPGETGQNGTGINIGGAEYTEYTSGSAIEKNVLVAGRAETDYYNNYLGITPYRNIYVSTANIYDDGTVGANEPIAITNYSREDAIKTTTPKIVKISDNKLYLLWEEYVDSINEVTEFKYVEIDHSGNMVGEIITAEGILSDCQPIVDGENIYWYATTGGVPTFYTLDTSTNTVTQNVATGTPYEYEPIVVEYDPEDPVDGGDETEVDTDDDDDDDDDLVSTVVDPDKDDNKVTETTDETIRLKDDVSEINYVNIPEGQKYIYPDEPATRMTVLTYISELIYIPTEALENSDNQFTDIEGLSAYEKDIVNMFSDAGLITGYPDGTFRPNGEITRAEFVTILQRISGEEITGESDNFSDVSGHWAEDEIEYFSRKGYVNGYTDGTFRPDENITNAEVIVTLNRITGSAYEDFDSNYNEDLVFYDLPENHWASKQILSVVNIVE